MKRFYLLFFFIPLFNQLSAQCTILPNAVAGISYAYAQGGGTNASGIAYNPNLNIYYAVIAGNSGFPYETFDAVGTSLFQTNAGFDFRGLWWNPNTNQVEGNGFNIFGLWTSNLNGGGYAQNTGTNIFTGQNQPDAQSCGDYDCQANEVIYYFNGSIYRYSRTNAAFLGSYPLTGSPVPVGNWNTTSVVYTGCAGNEIGIEDYIGKNILLFNKATGVYSGMSVLPASAVTNVSFRFSYANNLAWLYDVSNRKWTSYSIFSGTPSSGTVVNLGNDTTLCNGQILMLNAGNSGATFLWQDGSTNQTFTVIQTGTYYVAVNAGGCFISHDTINVTFNNGSLAVNIGNDTVICNGQPLLLDATTVGATGYLWSTGATSNTLSVNTSGNYWVQVLENGCTASDTIVVSLGVVTNSTSNVTICPNSTYTLPDGNIVSNAGTYIDTIPSLSGCDSIITTNLSIGLFSVDAGNNISVCNGDSTQLNATGGLIYSWTPVTGLSDPSIANPITSPSATTTYTVSSQVAIGNVIANGDFNSGNSGFSSIYNYTTNNFTEGEYYVGSNAAAWNGGMASCGDHTTGNGNMLCVNGATTPNISIYCETVTAVPNTTYAFSTWLMTLSAGNLAQLQFSINGNLLGSVFTANASTCVWQQFYTSWNSGSNTTATICIVNQNTNAGANDFALDDMLFAPLCTATDSVIVTVHPIYSDTIDASICQNQNYTLPGGTIVNTAGTYIDTLSTVYGCDSVITTNLTLSTTYAYTVFQTICPSDLYVLPNGTSVNTTGIFIDTLVSISGCDSIITTDLSVVPPSITVSNDTQICFSSSVQLNASGGLYSYSWIPTTGLSDSSIVNPIASPIQTISYVVTTQVASGDLIGNGNFESGNAAFSSSYINTTNLFPEGTYYVGTNPNTYHSGFSSCPDHTTGFGNMMIINGAGTPGLNIWCETINVVPNTNYAFGCWVTSVAVGSPAILQFQINNTLIGAPFNAPTGVCMWQQFYTVWNSGSNTTANICIINQNTTLGGNDFALDDISFNGLCNVRDTVTITVHNPTTANIDTAICQGTVYTFPNGYTSGIAAIDTSQLSDQFGCDSIIITNLTINPSPVVNIFDTICQGAVYLLPSGNSVTATGIYTDTLSTLLSCDSIIITNLTVRSISTTTFFDTICDGTSYTLPDGSIVIPSGPLSHATYATTLINQLGCDSLVNTEISLVQRVLGLTPSDVLCNGDSSGEISCLTNVEIGNPSFQIDLILNGVVISSIVNNGIFQNLSAGNYSAIITDSYGCSYPQTTQIGEPSHLVISDSINNVRCFGEDNGEIFISAIGGTPNYFFSLNNQSANSSGFFSSLVAGNYSYTATDANGCTDSSSVSVTEPQAVIVNLNPDSVIINLGESIQLNASSNYDPTATYLWHPNIGLSCYTCPNPIVESYYNIDYTLEVTANGCSVEVNIPVTVIPDYDIFIPNTFTPNGDGNNDFFQIFGNIPALKFVDIKIFSRIGEKVFESNDLNFKWDGNYKGKPLQPSVLVYTLQLVFAGNYSKKMYEGSLTLLK